MANNRSTSCVMWTETKKMLTASINWPSFYGGCSLEYSK